MRRTGISTSMGISVIRKRTWNINSDLGGHSVRREVVTRYHFSRCTADQQYRPPTIPQLLLQLSCPCLWLCPPTTFKVAAVSWRHSADLHFSRNTRHEPRPAIGCCAEIFIFLSSLARKSETVFIIACFLFYPPTCDFFSFKKMLCLLPF